MMQKLKYISVILGAVAFVACSDDERSPYLNGKDKTPITVTTNLSTGGTVTRAVDATFEKDDVLKAYIRHVVNDATNGWVDVTTLSENVGVLGINPRLVDFSVLSQVGTADNYSATKTLSTEGLYWDDFSNSSKDEAYLRTENHALQVFYGYGFNGGTPSTSLTETSGVIGWSVASDQRIADNGVDGFKTSDLIYAGTQTPVAYVHSTSVDADHGVLSIPYSHAMSKVSIVIDLQDGYESDDKNFANTIVTLKDVNTKCTVTAPTQELSGYGTEADVIMQPLATSENKLSKSFTALIAPTVMKNGQTLAKITDVHGNNYEINLTHTGLTTPASQSAKPWRSKLAAANAASVTPVASDVDLSTSNTNYNETTGGLTIPGVHYKLFVKIKKQQISVTASIRDWDEVEATGTGEIKFENDIVDVDGNLDALKEYGFDLYKMTKTTTIEGLLTKSELSSDEKLQIFNAYDANTANSNVVDYSSRVTWSPATAPVDASWSYDPYTYWQNKDDISYFRALAPAGSSNTTVENGKDLLWGTTDAHSGTDVKGNDYSYGEGDPIAPRTGKVPLKFYHAMSKITVKLWDANSTGTEAAKLDLDNAVIQFENLATNGTIDLHTGDVTAGDFAGQKTFSTDYYAASDQKHGCTNENPISDPHIIDDYIITPQAITDAATIIITLNNGTTYKAQLNKCTVKSSNPANNSNHPVGNKLSRWYSGTSYTYEIYLSKEIVEFRALIKKWDEVTAGGTITPEW